MDGALWPEPRPRRPRGRCRDRTRLTRRTAPGPILVIITIALTGLFTLPSSSVADPQPERVPETRSSTSCPRAAGSGPGAAQPPASWNLLFGGDTLLTHPRGGAGAPFADIRPSLAGADLALLNLETAITTRGRAQTKTYVFRSPPAFAASLAAAGVDIVSLANNHSLDYGTQGLSDTVEHLRNAGVAPTGAGNSLSEALRAAHAEVRGTCVAVLAASQIIPTPGWVATSSRAGVASAGKHVLDTNTQHILQAVAEARTTADVVVVILHWGIEGDSCPSPVQRQLGRLLLRAGATAVLGAHPHVLQPIVAGTYDMAMGPQLVAYSLGNFIWDPRSGATADTGVLELRFLGSALSGYTFHPHRLNANGWARQVPVPSITGQEISDRVANTCPGAPGRSSASFPSVSTAGQPASPATLNPPLTNTLSSTTTSPGPASLSPSTPPLRSAAWNSKVSTTRSLPWS